MPRLSSRSRITPVATKPNHATAQLLIYSTIVLFVSLGDSIMSYFAPVFVSQHTPTPFIMGIILSTSSVIGMAADFILSSKFNNKTYINFLILAILGALIFPLMFLMPYSWMQILLAMAIWGVYYECKSFSNFHAVHALVPKERHAIAWGIIATFQSTAYFGGPLIAILLLEQNQLSLLSGVTLIQIIALFGVLLFLPSLRRKFSHHQHLTPKKSLLHEIKAWKVLGRTLWPMLLFAFVMVMVDATFLNIGALLSESVRQEHPLGGYIITIYLLPGLFISLLAGRVSTRLGKKRTAFASASMGGLLLAIAGLMPQIELFILLVFISSMFLSIAMPETMAVFEDYIARLGKDSSDLIGLENSFTSLSYVVGPIVSGMIATIIGYQKTFSVFGMLLAFTGISLLLIVPRKIRLPQKQLHQIEN